MVLIGVIVLVLLRRKMLIRNRVIASGAAQTTLLHSSSSSSRRLERSVAFKLVRPRLVQRLLLSMEGRYDARRRVNWLPLIVVVVGDLGIEMPELGEGCRIAIYSVAAAVVMAVIDE